jgi:hypothetical protein
MLREQTITLEMLRMKLQMLECRVLLCAPFLPPFFLQLVLVLLVLLGKPLDVPGLYLLGDHFPCHGVL